MKALHICGMTGKAKAIYNGVHPGVNDARLGKSVPACMMWCSHEKGRIK